MMRSRPKVRSARRPGTGAALVRATLLFGPIALAIAFGVSPKVERHDRIFAQNGAGSVDTMTTGSVSSSRYALALGQSAASRPLQSCLKFPDGTQRGVC